VSTPPLAADELQRTVDVVDKHKRAGTRAFMKAAAMELGLSPGTVESRMNVANVRGVVAGGKREPAPPILPEFPDDDVSAEHILDHMARRFEQRKRAAEAQKWFEIRVQEDAPIGIIWFGDPHLGNNGCNVPLLRRDVALAAGTPGLYGANIGDTVDNWGSKLVHLYASNDVSRSTERRLARWFLQDSGVKWLLWLEGNHDRMDGSFCTYMRAINANVIPMVDWRARFKMRFPGGRSIRIDAAHNHKGHSQWNELHGQTRAAMLDEEADLYIAGHHHTWGLAVKELPGGRVATLARARGYKWLDDHAIHGGFTIQQNGAAILTVLDPAARSPVEVVRAFADAEEGAEYLAWKRARLGA
jgi:hypothetical protein